MQKGHEQPPTRKEGWDLFHSNKHESEAPRVRDIMTKERASGSSRSTSKDEDHHGYERSYDQRVTTDHEEWCIRYGFET